MKLHTVQRAGLALFILFLTACGPDLISPAPTPTEEPVQSRLPTAAPTGTPLPTATPVPVALNSTAISVPTPAPATHATATDEPLTAPQTAPPPAPLSNPTASCLAGQGGTVRLPGLRSGVTIPLDANIDRALDLAHILNVGWVHVAVKWSDLEPQPGAYQWQPVDTLTQGVTARNLKLLLTVTQSPAWATASGGGGLPDKPETLGAFAGALAAHAKGAIAAYEVWQSPNTAAANGGTVVVPGKYVDALQAAYGAIKQSDPCALVLNGALEPTAERDPQVAIDDLTFYRSMVAYKNGVFEQAHDILAVQLNTSGKPKEGKWSRRQPSTSRGFFSHVAVIRDEMLSSDEAEKQIWVVGAGYALKGDHAVTEKQQAEYLDGLYALSQDRYDWMSALFVRDLALNASGDDFSIVNPDGSPRPAYTRLQGMFEQQLAKAKRNPSIAGTDVGIVWERGDFSAAAPLVVGSDGVVYGGSKDGYVRTVDPNGAVRGRIRFARKGLLGLAVDGQQNVYTAAEDNTLERQTGGSTIVWNILTGSKLATPPVLSPNGDTLYIGTRGKYLDAYNTADGTKRWGFGMDGIPGTPTVDKNGTIYVGSSEGVLHAVGADGHERWNYSVGGWVQVAPLVGDAIYVVSDGSTAMALNSDGSPRWRTDLGAPPVGAALGKVGAGETLFVTTSDDKLIAAGDSGTAWTTELQSNGPTAPAVGGDGRIYVGGTDGDFRVVSQQGKINGSFGFNHPILLAPVVGKDGAVYVKVDDGALVAFGPKQLRQQYQLP